MSVSDYGAFNALYAMIILIITPLPILEMTIAKIIVGLKGERIPLKKIEIFFFKKILRWSFFFWCIGAIACPWLKSYFHLESGLAVYFVMCQMGLLLLLPSLTGILQGLTLYTTLCVVWCLLNLGRILAGGLLIVLYGRFSVLGAHATMFFGLILSFALSFVILERQIGREKNNYYESQNLLKLRKKFRGEFSGTFPVLALYYITIAFLLNVNIVIARHYLALEDAGLYAVAAIIGRIAYYLPGILVSVLFSETAGQASRNTILKLGLVAGLASGLFGLICWFWPELLIDLLIGEKYAGAASALRIIAPGMSFLAVANLFFIYFLGREHYTFLYTFIPCSILVVVLILLKFHTTSLEIATGMTGGAFGCLLLALVFWRMEVV